jgi:hypothetical protein
METKQAKTLFLSQADLLLGEINRETMWVMTCFNILSIQERIDLLKQIKDRENGKQIIKKILDFYEYRTEITDLLKVPEIRSVYLKNYQKIS